MAENKKTSNVPVSNPAKAVKSPALYTKYTRNTCNHLRTSSSNEGKK